MEQLTERAGKGGIVGETDFCGDPGDWHIGAEHIAGHEQTFAADVLMDSISRICLEFSHEIKFADIDMRSQSVDTQGFGEIMMDICQNNLDCRMK